MSNQLVEAVLPRLARKLYQELRHLKEGKLSEGEFTQGFEELLEQQHTWLISQGASEVQAALAIHGAVLVLSAPGTAEEAGAYGRHAPWKCWNFGRFATPLAKWRKTTAFPNARPFKPSAASLPSMDPEVPFGGYACNFEFRNSKQISNSKSEQKLEISNRTLLVENPKPQKFDLQTLGVDFEFRISDLIFPSSFEFRISNFSDSG